MSDIKTVQALVAFAESVHTGEWGASLTDEERDALVTEGKALIAQMQREAVQPAVPGTVDEILEWIVSMSDDEPIRNMARAARTKFAEAQGEREDAYDQIDRFLRNNMDDESYAHYSQALDLVWGTPPADNKENGNGR